MTNAGSEGVERPAGQLRQRYSGPPASALHGRFSGAQSLLPGVQTCVAFVNSRLFQQSEWQRSYEPDASEPFNSVCILTVECEAGNHSPYNENATTAVRWQRAGLHLINSNRMKNVERRVRGPTTCRLPSSLFAALATAVLWCFSAGSAWAVPTVDAGPAKVLDFPAKDLTLFGHATGSGPLTIQWTQVSGPAPVQFSAPWALATTASFTATGSYVFQLSATDGTGTATANATVTVNPASSQTAFYVDPTYAGTTQTGAATTPWTSLLETDSDFATKWNAITSGLATNDVIIYFSARQAGSDTSEQLVPPNGATLFINRGCRVGTPNCISGVDNTGSHRLTLDGMSLYNTNDTTPNWVAYTGAHKFKINCSNTCGSMSIGWGDDNQRDYVTIRGFEVTGAGARIRWGGNYSYLEYMWVHDVTNLGAEVQFNAAVSDYPACIDLGKDHDITIRNNLIERGVDEGLYIAGTYNYTRYGGCPSYGNTHSDILIENNTIRDPGANGGEGDGIDLKMGLINVTVRNNVIQNPHNAGEGGGINSPGVFPPARTNYLFEGNRIFDGTADSTHYSGGITLGGQNGTVIRNNLIYNTPGGAGINIAGDPTFPNSAVEIYNNTIYGNAGGVGFGDTHGAILRNNLVFANGTGLQIDGYNSDGIDSDYNLLAPTGSGFTEGSHSLVQSMTTRIVVNSGGADFQLASGSAAIDRGVSLAATGFANDIVGVTRPQGPAWDIGAYEYSPGGAGSDGGTGDKGSMKKGCGCSGGGFDSGGTLILLLAGMLARRRRARNSFSIEKFGLALHHVQ